MFCGAVQEASGCKILGFARLWALYSGMKVGLGVWGFGVGSCQLTNTKQTSGSK